MARPIQRGKKDKPKPKPKPMSTVKITDKSISGIGENQNVNQITIKIENPIPPKPKRRKPAKKKDTAKEEAIEELKQELANYDEIQTQAGQLGIELPAELGISPSEASALKNVSDIRSFIMIVKEKEGKITELVQLKVKAGTAPPPAGPSPNRFYPVASIIQRSGLPPPTIDIAPAPQRQGSAQSSTVERELDELDREQQKEALKIKRSPSIEKFREKNVQTENIILTIGANISTARAANNGVLTVSQLNNFITSYEQAMTRYNTNYAELSPQTQAIMRPQREALFAELSTSRKLLVDEKRGLEVGRQIPQALPQPKKKWIPTNGSGMAMLREYITIDMDTTEITPQQAQTMIVTLRSLKNPVLAEAFYTEIGKEPDAKKRQRIIREVIESRMEDNILPPGVPPAKPDWQPTATSGLPFLREFIRINPILTTVTSTQQRQMIETLKVLQPPLINSFITEIQNDKSVSSQIRKIRTVLNSRMKDATEDEKLLRDATEQEKEAAKAEQADIVQEEVDAENEANIQKAKQRLISWTNGEPMKKGYNNWGDKIIKDMITMGATATQITRITELSTKQQKKQAVKFFLTNPKEQCKPGRRSDGCVPPPSANAPPMASSRTQKPDTSSAPKRFVPMSGRNIPRGPKPEVKPVRFIQAVDNADLIRLRKIHQGSDIIIQPPLQKLGQSESFSGVNTRTPGDIQMAEIDSAKKAGNDIVSIFNRFSQDPQTPADLGATRISKFP